MPNRVASFLLRYRASVILAGLIWWGCLAPLPPHTLPDFRWSDKVVHLLMYLVFCSCIWAEYLLSHHEQSRRHSLWQLSVFTLVLPVLMSGAIELAQAYLTTGRSGDWADFAANSIGCALAFFLGKHCMNKIKIEGGASK